MENKSFFSRHSLPLRTGDIWKFFKFVRRKILISFTHSSTNVAEFCKSISSEIGSGNYFYKFKICSNRMLTHGTVKGSRLFRHNNVDRRFENTILPLEMKTCLLAHDTIVLWEILSDILAPYLNQNLIFSFL